MSKKTLLLGILVAALFFVLIKVGIDLNSHGGSVQIAAQKINNNITYKIHTNYNQGNYDYSRRGYYVNTLKMPDSPWFYIITMGEKNTGGYSIEISEINIDENNNVRILVKENSPKARRNSNYGIYMSSYMCRIKWATK